MCRRAAGRAGRCRSRPLRAHSAARFVDDPARQYRRQVRRRLQGRGGRGLSGRQPPRAASPRWAAAGRTPPPSPSPPPSARNAATSTPMSTASTPPTRASPPRRASWTRSPSRRCWNWPPRRQGAADPLGRTGDALQGAAAGAVLVRGYRRELWNPGLRRGGNHGIESCLRRRLFAATRPR